MIIYQEITSRELFFLIIEGKSEQVFYEIGNETMLKKANDTNFKLDDLKNRRFFVREKIEKPKDKTTTF